MSNSISGIFGVVSDVIPGQSTNAPTKVRMVNEATRSDNNDDKLWVTAVFWDKKQSSVVEQYFVKGKRVFIEGCLQPHKYEDKLYLDLNVSRFDFISSGESNEESSDEKPTKSKKTKPEASDDEIPF